MRKSDYVRVAVAETDSGTRTVFRHVTRGGWRDVLTVEQDAESGTLTLRVIDSAQHERLTVETDAFHSGWTVIREQDQDGNQSVTKCHSSDSVLSEPETPRAARSRKRNR